MDPYIRLVEELFSAAQNLKTSNTTIFIIVFMRVYGKTTRRWEKKINTWDILNTYGSDYKCIFVGDASMSPYEILYPGGANEYWNEESGSVWLERARTQWPSNIWINPYLFLSEIHAISRNYKGNIPIKDVPAKFKWNRPGHETLAHELKIADQSIIS